MSISAGTAKPPEKLLRILLVIIYFVCLLLIAVFAFRRPLYNWDLLPYMALVIQKDHKEADTIHALTYKEAKEHIPATEYGCLIDGDKRKLRAENADAFYATLPFYAVKPLYIAAVRAFYKAGFNLPLATVMPSIVCYILTGLLLFYWITRHLSFIWAFAAGLLIMFTGFMVFAARQSTPDMFSAMLLLTAFYFIIEKPSVNWLFFFLLLSMFARLDNIIPAFLIVSFLFFYRKWEKKINTREYLLMTGMLILTYFAITTITLRPFGWDLSYYPTFVKYLDLSGRAHTSFSITAYLALLYSQVIASIVYNHFLLFMFLLLLILYSPSFSFKSLGFDQILALLFLLIIVVRFILFPDLSDRFNISYYLCFFILLLRRFKHLLSKPG